MDSDPPPARGSAPRRVGFRIAFVFFVLYALPFPLVPFTLGFLPDAAVKAVSERLHAPYAEGMDAAVKWVGKACFGLEITIGPAGSGDTTWNYVQLAAFAAVAAAAALLWTLLDRRGRDHDRLHDGLRVYLRFYLSTTMLGYGAMKVIKSQFVTPGLDRLMQPFGEHSPMGLLWDFMGFSDAYCIFTGAAEMSGGALLVARRTTTFGALVSTGVLANVVMLNFCFDTPVKLFSSVLLAMALFLALPDAGRLCDFLLFHRPFRLAPLGSLFRWRWANVSAIVLRTAFVGASTWSLLAMSWSYRKQGDLAPRPPLYGAWDVEVFEVDGELVPEESGAGRWRRILLGRYRGRIDRQDGSMQLFAAQASPAADRLTLTRRDEPSSQAVFTCLQPTSDILTLDGAFEGRELHVELTRSLEDPFLLTRRGFHWINETPFNR